MMDLLFIPRISPTFWNGSALLLSTETCRNSFKRSAIEEHACGVADTLRILKLNEPLIPKRSIDHERTTHVHNFIPPNPDHARHCGSPCLIGHRCPEQPECLDWNRFRFGCPCLSRKCRWLWLKDRYELTLWVRTHFYRATSILCSISKWDSMS